MSRRARRGRRRGKESARLKREKRAESKRTRLLQEQGWVINQEGVPVDDLVKISCP